MLSSRGARRGLVSIPLISLSSRATQSAAPLPPQSFTFLRPMHVSFYFINQLFNNSVFTFGYLADLVVNVPVVFCIDVSTIYCSQYSKCLDSNIIYCVTF